MIYLDYLLDKILSFIVCVFYGNICAWSVYFNFILLPSCFGISWKKRLLSILAILIFGIEFGVDFERMFWKSDEICDFCKYKGILKGIISHLKILSPFVQYEQVIAVYLIEIWPFTKIPNTDSLVVGTCSITINIG